MDESVAIKFETYEDYLDSFITDTDRFYLEEVRLQNKHEKRRAWLDQVLLSLSTRSFRS